MHKNKFLALFLTVCMTLTSIGALGITASAETVTEINVGQGATYLLPDGVTYADTSKVGYRIVEGTDGITYRVNVGEYKEIIRDTFDDYYEAAEYTTKINNKAIPGGTFYKTAYTKDTEQQAVQLVNDGENTFAAMGPQVMGYANMFWTPNDDKLGDAFKVSVKLKVVDFIPSKASSSHVFAQLRPKGTNGIVLRAYTDANMGIEKTQIGSAGVNKYITEPVEWIASTEGDVTSYSMKDYVTITMEGNSIQHSMYTSEDNKESCMPWNNAILTDGLCAIQLAKNQKASAVNAVVYADDMVFSRAVYVTDTLENLSVSADIKQGASTAQTATVALNMSDNTTKDFTVNYTADTSSAGIKTANGTIDGFDGTIPVTYSVTGIVVNDDFQSAELGTLTPGNPLNGWTVTNTKGTVDDTVITFEKEEYPNHHITSNNVLKINRTADDTAESKDYVLRRELAEPVSADDADLISVKFNMLRNNNNTIKFTVGLESEYEGGTAAAPFEFILVASQIYLPGSQTPIYFDGKYDEYSPRVGIWHEFEILADIKNDYVYFYERDELLGSGRIENAAQKLYGLSAITLESDSTGNGSFNNGGGFIWIDNINVELFSEQEALQEAGSRLSSLFRGRISDDINLPDKGWYNTDINWESDNGSVVDNNGKITRPESGSTAKAELTATVSKTGLTTEKFYYTAEINPLSVLLDESFETYRLVNGQPMSARPYTGGMVPWHGWIPAVYSENVNWDTSGTIVAESETNNAFRLERTGDASTDSQLYTWSKLLEAPVEHSERVSVSFRVLKDNADPRIRIGFGEDWITDFRLYAGTFHHSDVWATPPKFEAVNSSANLDEWYHLEFLIDFPSGKCYAYCDGRHIESADTTIPTKNNTFITFDSMFITHYRGSGKTSDAVMLDDIVVNKLSEAEFTAKKSAYDNAAFSTVIKDVSLDRGAVNTVSIRNTEALSSASGVIVAEYGRDDEKLKSVKIYSIPDVSNKKIMQTVNVSRSVLSGNKVKIYVWDKSTVKPLALPSETIIP